MENPFRVSGIIKGPYFTNRDREIARVVSILREPQAKLVVYGPRRMGKSSILTVAAQKAQQEHGIPIVLADVSTVSGEADIASRIMQQAVRAFETRWQDVVKRFAKRLSASLQLSVDPVTGLPTIGIEPRVRDAATSEQQQVFRDVLDTIEELAAARGTVIGIILDEFQEIHAVGGEQAEWHLRGVIQQHQHVSYVLAGSQESLIREMIGNKKRAFYDLAERLHVGPIDAAHMERWIESRFSDAGMTPDGIGNAIVQYAGPRTRDRIRLARTVYNLAIARRDNPSESDEWKITPADVKLAFDVIADELEHEHISVWRDLSAIQQNVLRAVAARVTGLFSADVRERFSLGKTSGSTVKAVRKLEDAEILTRDQGNDAYVFDSPFFGQWVLINTLRDVGIVLPST